MNLFSLNASQKTAEMPKTNIIRITIRGKPKMKCFVQFGIKGNHESCNYKNFFLGISTVLWLMLHLLTLERRTCFFRASQF